MTFALKRQAGNVGARILGLDFSYPMLERAIRKSNGKSPLWIEGDAMNLPFADGSLDLVTSAFGFRNLADYDMGLREIVRVLRPGGQLGILERAEPGGAIGKMYGMYFKRVLPAVGTAISGVKGAYSYLPASADDSRDPMK